MQGQSFYDELSSNEAFFAARRFSGAQIAVLAGNTWSHSRAELSRNKDKTLEFLNAEELPGSAIKGESRCLAADARGKRGDREGG